MKWRDGRRVLASKLDAEQITGAKHDGWFVRRNGVPAATVLDSHGEGDVTNRERGHIAESLRINERELRELIKCSLSADDYFAKLGI